MRYIQLLAVSACLLVPAIVRAAPTTTSPGKTSVFAVETGELDANGNMPPLTGQIAKGKKKTVLKIDATVQVYPNPAVIGAYVFVNVNNHAAQPDFAYADQCDTSSGVTCTVSATFWLDIDAAEIAFPGVYAGQPLDITVVGGNSGIAGLGVPTQESFSALVVKK